MKRSTAQTPSSPLSPTRRGTAFVLALVALLAPACADDGADPEEELYASDETGGRYEHDDEQDQGQDQDQEPVADDRSARCDFSAMTGVWVSAEGSELPYKQTIVLGPDAERNEVVGYTVLYTEAAQLCAFDLTCIPNDEHNSYRVAATLTDEEHRLDCAEGFYEFSQNAATPFHMSYSLNASGAPEFAGANFVRSQWGSDQ